MARTGARAAVVLAGGRAQRMDGVNKPLLDVGGRPLLHAAVGAAREAGCAPIVIVGPPATVNVAAAVDVVGVREDPPFAGPVAAVAAALAHVSTPWMLLLAADLPRAGALVSRVLDVPPGPDGARLDDEGGRPQWLAGLYRTAALRLSLGALPDAGRGAALRSLIGALDVRTAVAPACLTADVDTWDDLHTARQGTYPEQETS